MPHVDGQLYYPTVSTISLGSYTYLDFYEPFQIRDENSDNSLIDNQSLDKRYMFSLLIEPRSLLILKKDMYDVYLHGIKENTEDIVDQNRILNYEHLSDATLFSNDAVLKRDKRVSLTIRYVPNCVKVSKNIFFNKKIF